VGPNEGFSNVMVAGAGQLFWLTNTTQGGALLSMPVGGGTPLVLASSLPTTYSLAVDSTHVYWADAADGGGRVNSVPLAGGAAVTIIDGTVDPGGSPWINIAVRGPARAGRIARLFAKRWDVHGDTLNSEEEILAKASLAHQGPQVAVGSGDEPCVDVFGLNTAERGDLACLDDAKQLRLRHR
jgi:hypothetical protein